MKKLLLTALILSSSLSFATTPTDMSKSKWVCTTNASSSDVEKDKAADEKMANTSGSGTTSFAFAVKNCRDCTKITCEVKE